MTKYRKKPVVINAIKWDGMNFEELYELLDCPRRRAIYDESDMSLKIETPEGTIKARVGDYIIKGVKGDNKCITTERIVVEGN